MKLFVIAALIAVAAAGRLEHLEHSYLPPDNNAISVARSNVGSGFGANSGSPGSFGGHSGSFGGQSGSFGAAGAGQPRYNAGAFPSATSSQYLPPNYGSASNNGPQFGASARGFGSRNLGSQQPFDEETGYQYDVPSSQYGSPADSSSAQARYQPQQFGGANQQLGNGNQQFGAASRQYLAPRAESTQYMPQQAFDEETGYHY